MVDFWTWAYGDLLPNNVRGVFAEWMVAELLGPSPPRGSWDDFDLVPPDGRKVEVKAGAFRQSWHDAGTPPSAVVFAGLKGRRWDPATRRYSEAPTHNADLYVFCVQVETELSRRGALDLGQWRFHVLPREAIERLDAASLRPETVARSAPALRAEELRSAVLGGAPPQASGPQAA